MLNRIHLKNKISIIYRKSILFLNDKWDFLVKFFKELKDKVIKHKLIIIFFIINSFVFFILGSRACIINWTSNKYSLFIDVLDNFQIKETVSIIALIALYYQYRQFRKEGHHKFMDTLDNWLIGFQSLMVEKRLHENWDTFAINMINHADRICYFALKKLISPDLVVYFKDQITSAYAIAFTNNCYLEKHYKDIDISNIRKNANSIEEWCKQQGWKLGDQLLPDDKKP